jgi:16S rRNA A1518/A1519 N6-dimethyltransferase RsmA/KsgA/DIM1 with predicted DNA glycosylase/AP lyase activity
MYVGPVVVDESKIIDFLSVIPKDAAVLELGAGNGAYSVAIRRKTSKFIAVEPDARLIRCIIANAETHHLHLGAVNAMISPLPTLAMIDRTLSEETIHADDTIRVLPLEDFLRCVGYDFEYIVVHEPSFLEHVTKYYPEFVDKCIVLKNYTL